MEKNLIIANLNSHWIQFSQGVSTLAHSAFLALLGPAGNKIDTRQANNISYPNFILLLYKYEQNALTLLIVKRLKEVELRKTYIFSYKHRITKIINIHQVTLKCRNQWNKYKTQKYYFTSQSVISYVSSLFI